MRVLAGSWAHPKEREHRRRRAGEGEPASRETSPTDRLLHLWAGPPICRDPPKAPLTGDEQAGVIDGNHVTLGGEQDRLPCEGGEGLDPFGERDEHVPVRLPLEPGVERRLGGAGR